MHNRWGDWRVVVGGDNGDEVHVNSYNDDDSNGALIAYIDTQGYFDLDTAIKCATIIAAAPDLLEAVKTAIAYMEKTSSNADIYHAEMILPLRVAIAKAEGVIDG